MMYCSSHRLRFSLAVCSAAVSTLLMAQEPAPQPPPAPAPAEAEQAPKPVSPETVVATVNGTEVTEGEIRGLVAQAMQRFGGQLPPQQLQMMMPQMREMATSQAIDRVLLAEAAQKSGIQVADEKVEEMVTRAKESLPEGLTLEEALKEMNLDVDSWKTEIKSQMQIEELVSQKIAEAPEATEEEVKAFYDAHPQYFETPATVTASHILLGFEEGDTDEVKAEKKAKLEGIKKQIDEGGDFAVLAKEHSSCPSSQKGGDLGSFGKGQMVPPFEKAAFTMEPGELSGIVETSFGYHLIKVTKKSDAGKQPLEDAKGQISQHLNQQNKEGAWTTYVESLRKDADIVMAGQE